MPDIPPDFITIGRKKPDPKPKEHRWATTFDICLDCGITAQDTMGAWYGKPCNPEAAAASRLMRDFRARR